MSESNEVMELLIFPDSIPESIGPKTVYWSLLRNGQLNLIFLTDDIHFIEKNLCA